MPASKATLLLAFMLSSTALADRREFYFLLEGGAGVQMLRDAATATQRGTGVGPAGELQFLYGLTNSLHLGVYGRGFYAPDIEISKVTPTLTDGSQPTGTLYQNVFGFGGGALVRWRFDLGFPIAPFAQLELGLSWTRFALQQLIPEGKDFAIGLPLRDQVAPDGRFVIGLEYRLIELLILELRLGGRRSLAPVSEWQLDAGLAVGVVW